MTQQINGDPNENMHTGMVPPQQNHGGHEMFDVSEILSGAVNALNLYALLKPHVKDPELLDLMNRQEQFMMTEYNTIVECFQTGVKPSVSTQVYNMKQGNDFVYGLKQTPPVKPIGMPGEITDQVITSLMLNMVKSNASLKGMATTEVTNPTVRRVLADTIPNCIEMAYEISIYQNKHHYYQVPQLPAGDMQQMVNAYAPVQMKQH
ncbi:spore coat protein [Metabacillus indicus]|uniref:spore coat protein n=1 Tax=Metabacillus indicus TaxID=246786 RepID=UPI002A0071D8|nr:spore coat protein [Metabacillus indicus]MDX8290494.1 spore coat protein [Metabacillus indicus]